MPVQNNFSKIVNLGFWKKTDFFYCKPFSKRILRNNGTILLLKKMDVEIVTSSGKNSHAREEFYLLLENEDSKKRCLKKVRNLKLQDRSSHYQVRVGTRDLKSCFPSFSVILPLPINFWAPHVKFHLGRPHSTCCYSRSNSSRSNLILTVQIIFPRKKRFLQFNWLVIVRKATAFD